MKKKKKVDEEKLQVYQICTLLHKVWRLFEIILLKLRVDHKSNGISSHIVFSRIKKWLFFLVQETRSSMWYEFQKIELIQ